MGYFPELLVEDEAGMSREQKWVEDERSWQGRVDCVGSVGPLWTRDCSRPARPGTGQG